MIENSLRLVHASWDNYKSFKIGAWTSKWLQIAWGKWMELEMIASHSKKAHGWWNKYKFHKVDL